MRLFSLALVLALSLGSTAVAKTVTLDGEGASIDIPDTWQTKAQAAGPVSTTTSVILQGIDSDKSAMVQVMVCSNPQGMQATHPDLVANIKENLTNQTLSHGGQIQFTSEGKVSLNDVPAYLIQYTVTTPSSPRPPMTARNYQVAANGKIYLLSLRTVTATGDADLQAIANSFRFDSPPVLPAPRMFPHRIRYYLIAAAAAVIVLVGLGVGIYYFRQRQLYE
jgi:hypothetical protein